MGDISNLAGGPGALYEPGHNFLGLSPVLPGIVGQVMEGTILGPSIPPRDEPRKPRMNPIADA